MSLSKSEKNAIDFISCKKTRDRIKKRDLPETGKLDMWYCCPYCGYEGFIQDIEHCPEDEECKEFLKQVLEGE